MFFKLVALQADMLSGMCDGIMFHSCTMPHDRRRHVTLVNAPPAQHLYDPQTSPQSASQTHHGIAHCPAVTCHVAPAETVVPIAAGH